MAKPDRYIYGPDVKGGAKMSDTKKIPDDNPATLTGLPSYLLTRISHRHAQNTHAELKAIGLTTIATRVIVALSIFEELSVNDLCVHAVANQPTMSRALDRLQEDGLIERRTSQADSRSRMVRLTVKGAALFEDIWPVMMSGNEALMKGIPARDRAVTMRTLVRMLENIRKHPI